MPIKDRRRNEIFSLYWVYQILLGTSCLVLFPTTFGLAMAPSIPSPTCSPPEGYLKVVVADAGEGWVYAWGDKMLEMVKEQNFKDEPLRVPDPRKRYGGLQEWNIKETGVEQSIVGIDYRLDTPYSVSPGENWLVSAVYPKLGKFSHVPPTRLALIDRSEKRVVFFKEFPFSIKALTWSPSGGLVALLLAEPVEGPFYNFPLKFLGSLFGHPVIYYSLRVGLYDLMGEKICEQLFREQVSEGGGYLEWITPGKDR
ncbi:MAG: hypothetical protein KC643_26365 [Nitrospira sp.]|nr:hypothetical protein [Nitrospira sp.]MDR4485454.1 hypothetical protein [Nitrospirales bacterium]